MAGIGFGLDWIGLGCITSHLVGFAWVGRKLDSFPRILRLGEEALCTGMNKQPIA